MTITKIITKKPFRFVHMFFLFFVLISLNASAQQLNIKDFVLFGGNGLCPSGPGQKAPLFPGCGVILGSSTTVQQGSIGSYRLVTSTGNSTINANIYSGGTVQLTNSNVVTGKITAANSAGLSGNILSTGSSANISGNIDVNGNILIGGGTVTGKVTHPGGTSYNGPTPAGGEITGPPTLPILPAMPAINTFPTILANAVNINNNKTIVPGVFGDLTLGGNKTLTFNGSGDYVFRSIKNSGTTNNFVFDFGLNNPRGIIKIYVQGDIDLNKVLASIKGDGSESRIYTETHGTGSTSSNGTIAFNIANGSAGSTTKWLGSVWAPYGAITIGAGTGTSDLSGALWSGTQVNILSGVVVSYSPLAEDKVIVPFNPINAFKVSTVIGAELTSLIQSVSEEAKNQLVILNGFVLIDVIAIVGKESLVYNYLINNGMPVSSIIPNGSNTLITTGMFPIARLLELNGQGTIINFCRPVFAPLGNSGLIENAGDKAIGSDLVRNGYSLQGEGVKIGVISDSYNTLVTSTSNPAEADISTGELPGAGNPVNSTPVQVLLDYPYFPRSDEGRAMLQVVHDIAPKATLAFRTGFISPGDFTVGIKQLQEAGCNVIVDDITFINEPFLEDGPVAKMVNLVKSLGVSYFTSAGNFSNKSHEQNYRPVAAPAVLPAGTTAHDFSGTGDIYQRIRLKPGAYTIALQWEDSIYSVGQTHTGTKNDFDLYLTDVSGNIICGYNRDNTLNVGGDPFEFLSYTVDNTVTEIDANILITRANSGTPAPRFKYIIFRGNAVISEYQSGMSTIVGQANAAGAITVAAINYFKTPAYSSATPVIAPYSSIGGTKIGNVDRNKPDITAPDGVNTSVNMGPDYSGDTDPFSNFFGTSAAAPHAAATAALLIEGRKRFLLEQNVSPDVIKNLLQATALNVGAANAAGAGLIQADIAMRTFASPKPSLISLSYPATITATSPPTSSFTLTINGDYLTNASVVLFRGVAIPTTYISTTQLTAIIPAFTGNPSIQVYTAPLANGDGGYSNTILFFSITKKNIKITADSKTKKYGELLPNFTSTILVNNIPLAQTSPLLSLADIGLQNLSYTTNATAMSNAGNQYFIKPVRTFDPANGTDVGLLEIYNYDTIPGVLTIQKLPVLVTPNDQTITYGQYPANITFTYQFDNTNMPDAAGLLNIIKTSHESYLPDNALAVISNGNTLTDANLANLSVISSVQSIINARKFELVNGQLSAVTNPNSFNLLYLVDIAAQSIIDYKSNPVTTNLITPYFGINSRAMLNAVSLSNGISKVYTNGNLVQMVNGNLVQMVNGNLGQQLPIVNGNLVQLVNGNLVQLVNGVWVPIANTQPVQLLNGNLVQFVNNEWVVISNGNLVQLVNGNLVQMVNGNLVQMVNGNLVQIVNGNLVQIVNGNLVQLVNGQLIPVANGNLVQMVNGNLVQLVNGNLVQMVNAVQIPLANVVIANGNLVQLVNSIPQDVATNNTGVIIDAGDALNNGYLDVMSSMNMITGLTSGVQKLIPGALRNDNLLVTYSPGKVTINKAVISVKVNDITRPYGEANPALTVIYSGFVPGENLQNSDVTGTHTVSTTATQISPVSPPTYPITLTIGTLVSSNYSFNLINGVFTILNNPCLLTRNPFTNFGSTSNPGTATSLWLNIEAKISGQLNANGKYLYYTGGSVSFSNITSTPTITNMPIPNGKIIADNFVTVPFSSFDASSNTWITKVPVGYSSTSDIFISGVIINSSKGFVKKNGANSIVKGIFYSNTAYNDQWTYGIAAYQPQFDYSSISGEGKVISINGTYKAGTPLPQIANLVNGASGGGGNNFTGSTSSYDNFTSCTAVSSFAAGKTAIAISGDKKDLESLSLESAVQVIPNPASNFINISFTSSSRGGSSIALYTIDGKKVFETQKVICEAGKKYQQKIDVSKLVSGVYIIQLRSTDKTTIKKIIISR